MSKSELIQYNGKLYTIVYLDYEPDEVFFKRAWFIVKQEPSSQEELNHIIHQSKIWSNIHFKGYEYSKEVMDSMKQYKDIYI